MNPHEGADVTVTLEDVSIEDLHKIWRFTSVLNRPFWISVEHPTKEETK